MINKVKLTVSAALAGAALLVPTTAFAATNLVPTQLTVQTDILQIITAVIRVVLLIAFVLAFVFLLIGGLRWITSGGDEKAVSGARGMITAALIGLVIVLVAYALIKLVETFFGVSLISGTVCIPNISGGCT